MIDWLGVGHLLELSLAEAAAGLLTPLAIFAAFFVAQLALPGVRVPGYVIDSSTGQARRYRLNGILVFAIALAVWATELTGIPRDWFYRSSIPAVAGGTVFTAIFAGVAVLTQPADSPKGILAALWNGRVRELSFFNNRVDLKMYFYVVGGTMLSLNALSGAAYHYQRFGDEFNPGVFLYAGFLTLYVLDYFVFERVQLYTFDVIHEKLGFKMFWGGMVVFGWLFTLPLWGMAAHPSPGFQSPWVYLWLVAAPVLYVFGNGVARATNMQKYTFKRWPERKYLGIFEPEYIQAGDRKILCSGFWGLARHLNYMGEFVMGLAIVLAFGHFANPWSWIYLAYAVTLFTIRQREDDRYCAEKYGDEKWAEYQDRVRYRIIPGIY